MVFFPLTENVPISNKDLISWIFDDPQYDQDEPMYIDAKNAENSISLNQARVLVRKLVAGFHAAGLQKGDCVCINSFNDINYPILFLGIIAAGGIFAGTNPSYTPFELTHHLHTASAKFLITEPEMLPQILEASKSCNISEDKIWIFDVLEQALPEGYKSWKQLLRHGEKEWERFEKEGEKGRTAARLFSSGTTGLPKAAELSHGNLVAEHTLTQEINRKPWKQVRLVCLPMFHAACVPVTHTSVLKSGTPAVIMRRFDLEEFLEATDRFQVTEWAIVPPIVIGIIMSPVTKKYSLKSVRNVIVGAAPLGRESQLALKKLLVDECFVLQVWGMTELSCVASMFYYPEDDDTGSIGRIIPNCEAKLIDDDGNEITAYDTAGELTIRGPIAITSYFRNPLATASSFTPDGFLKTGDIVYCSAASKKWYIVDRKKELIKVRAFQVAPPEIESLLLGHPGIVDAGVVGVLVRGEECPRAYVVRRPGKNDLSEEEVVEWCAARLAGYKRLTGGVRFVDAIPKNASGKILKRVLRDEASKEGEKAKL